MSLLPSRFLIPGLAAALIFLVPAGAGAARPARVDISGARVLAGPAPEAEVITTLDKGRSIAVSNLPTQGYYKVRLPSGEIGWMAADTLILFDAPGGEAGMDSMDYDDPFADGGGSSSPRPLKENPVASPGAGRVLTRRKRDLAAVRVRAVGGMDFWNPAEIQDQLGLNDLTLGFNAGGEVHFVMTPQLAMVSRVEYLRKDAVGRDTSTLETYAFTLSSTLATVGLELTLSGSRVFSFHTSLLGGLALNTRFRAIHQNTPEPNETLYSNTGFTGMAKAGVVWHFHDVFQFLIEGGYRHIKTKELSPTELDADASIFKDSEGNTRTFPIDLSGFFVGAGLQLSF